MDQLYGAVEFGGTKTICAIGRADGTLQDTKIITTTSAEQTLGAVVEYFKGSGEISALGVAAFGPLDLDPDSPKYGSLRHSPKNWGDVELKRPLEEQLGVAVKIDTDVNCAALGEAYFGVAKDFQNILYLTFGTGIGGGLLINRQPYRGILNLEVGHLRIPHDGGLGDFSGVCKFHGDCLEGLASGEAMRQKYGAPAENISDPRAWELEAKYLAHGIYNLILSTGPQIIVLGGGLIKHDGLIESVRQNVSGLMNDYLPLPDMDRYIVRSSGDFNAVQGAIKLCRQPN